MLLTGRFVVRSVGKHKMSSFRCAQSLKCENVFLFIVCFPHNFISSSVFFLKICWDWVQITVILGPINVCEVDYNYLLFIERPSLTIRYNYFQASTRGAID
jgi:hypothetical protein